MSSAIISTSQKFGFPRLVAYSRLLRAHRRAIPSCKGDAAEAAILDSYGTGTLADRLAENQLFRTPGNQLKADDLKRVVVWKNLLLIGTEHCALWHTAEGWLVKGTVVGVLKDQRPMLASYEIYCDENWLTHRVQVERTIGSDVKSLSMTVESRGVWRSSVEELRDIHGCDDVDLALTPATNTLPIRRLKLQVGSSQSVIAAWVKFPELTVQPLSQPYTRLAKNRYRYESNNGFTAEIAVDDLGLVTNYPGGWERIATL